MWPMPLLAFDYLTVTVSSEGTRSEHSFVAHSCGAVYPIDGGNDAATKIDSRYC